MFLVIYIRGGYNFRKFVRNDIIMGIVIEIVNNYYNVVMDINS